MHMQPPPYMFSQQQPATNTCPIVNRQLWTTKVNTKELCTRHTTETQEMVVPHASSNPVPQPQNPTHVRTSRVKTIEMKKQQPRRIKSQIP